MGVRRISRETLVAVYHLVYNVAQLNKPREMHFSARAVPNSTGCGCHPRVLVHHLLEDAGSRLPLRRFFTTFPFLRELLSLSPAIFLFSISFCQRFFASANVINFPHIFIALEIVQIANLIINLRVTFIRLFVNNFLLFHSKFFNFYAYHFNSKSLNNVSCGFSIFKSYCMVFVLFYTYKKLIFRQFIHEKYLLKQKRKYIQKKMYIKHIRMRHCK